MAAVKKIALPAEEISVSENHAIRKLQWISGAVGLIALIIAAILGLSDGRQFFFSYLTAYMFVLTLGLGALFFVLIQFVTRAGWSVAVRRIAENLMATIPFLAILFVPLLFGLDEIYSWFGFDPSLSHDPLIEAKQAYLNPTFFYLRIAVYLLSWTFVAYWFRKKSLQQDQQGGSAITLTLQTASAPAIVWFAITVNFASFDLLMSLDPHWYSTIFGVYVFGGAFMSALALMILAAILFQRSGLLRNIINSEHYHDLGKLLFGFVVFWAYIGFSQFMLIWYANIPEETIWYAHRLEHGWEYVSILLAAGHFAIPFFILLSRSIKRNKPAMIGVTLWVLFMHYVDIYWLAMPTLHEHFHASLLDLMSLVGLGGIFFAVFLRLSAARSLVPREDPRLAESLSFENL